VAPARGSRLGVVVPKLGVVVEVVVVEVVVVEVVVVVVLPRPSAKKSGPERTRTRWRRRWRKTRGIRRVKMVLLQVLSQVLTAMEVSISRRRHLAWLVGPP
jgi:hypothetical protein